MDTLRIFIASPGDVTEERERARQVVQGLRRRYAQHFDLRPVFWEDLPLALDISFQQGIDLVLSKDRGVDVAVFILWSRLGSPLGPLVRGADGREYRSGTERELALMLEARQAQGGERPQILAYARQDEAAFEEALRGRTTAEKEELLRQKKLVEEFLREEFHDAETGVNVRAYHTFTRPQSFAERLRVHLQEILDGLCAGKPARPVWEVDARGPPFRGLEAFRVEHVEIFFGREDEVAEARARLGEAARRGTAFLLIGGASGTGKSSLAAAGLVPEIVAHETDETVGRWLHATFTPAALGGDPATGMARILMNAVPTLAERASEADLAEALVRDPVLAVKLLLLPALKATAKPGEGAVRLVLLADQLEELFTDLRLGEQERTAFAAILRALATSGSVWVIATLRADWYLRLLDSSALVALKTAGAQLDLVPPGLDAVRRMIESPAVLAGLTYEQSTTTSLADRILRDVADRAELLPLLEDLLRELFERRTEGGALTFSAYEMLGGVEGSLAKRAEVTLASLPVDVQITLPEVLRRLVATGDGVDAAPVRRRAPLAVFPEGSPARALVDRLVADRLATASGGNDGTPEVAIAHEAILRVWPRAAAWIKENAEFLRVRDRLAARMRENAPLSAADPLLPAAKAILATQCHAIEPDVAAYVEGQVAAIDADRRRHEKTRRMVITGLSALTVAASITAAAALWQWREANAARNAEAVQRATAEEATARTSIALASAEAESTKAKRQLYTATLYKLCAALDRPQRSIANDFFREATEAYRDGYGDACEPIELTLVRPVIDGSIVVLKGHDRSIKSVAFSPDGMRLATGSEDDTARVWDAVTGELLAVLKGHENRITCLAFSPDGTRLATGSWDDTARLWEVATGESLVVLRGHEGGITSLAFSSDGTRLATGSVDNTARLWDTATGELLFILNGHENFVFSLAFSPDGTRLATGAYDSTARVWDVATGKPIFTLTGNKDWISPVVFSPDGTCLAMSDQDMAGSADNTVRLWDVTTGESMAVLKGHENRITSLAFSPDGTRLATGSGDNTARLWEAATGSVLAVLKGHEGGIVSLAFSPDGTYLLTGSLDSTARLWDAVMGESLSVLDSHDDGIESLAFSPDGTRLATGSGHSTARLWDAATGESLAALRPHRWITCLAFSPDGSRLATGSLNGTAGLWDAATGECLFVLKAHDIKISTLAYSPDGKRFATGSDIDNIARLWDAATGDLIFALRGHEDGISSVMFSPDGGRLVTASGNDRRELTEATARMWDVGTGELLAVLKGHQGGIEALAFSPDGMRLATGSHDNTARVWDAVTGAVLAVLKGHEGRITSLAFSPDGTRLATGSDDHTAHIWDAATGISLAVLKGHEGGLGALAFSPDGTRLATGSGDNTADIWDVGTGELLAVLKGHKGRIETLAFSPDGLRLATGASDGTTRLWGLSNADIHASRIAAAAIRPRLAPVVDEWFTGDLQVVKMKLAAAKATMPAADWHEASNLVLVKARAERDPASLIQAGNIALVAGNLEAARDHYEKAVPIMESFASQSPRLYVDGDDLMGLYWKLGLLAGNGGKWVEASAWFDKAMTIADRLFKDSSSVEAATFRIAVLKSLAECHAKLGKAEAAAACERRIAELEAAAKDGSASTAPEKPSASAAP